MADPVRRRGTYEDVLRAPEFLLAEVADCEMYLRPRPTIDAARARTRLGVLLGTAYDLGRGGPGGWVLLDEPELHLGLRPDVVVPDLAGWRRARMPKLPSTPHLTLAPDWVCQVVSADSANFDRGTKQRVYAREGVELAWFVDPARQLLEVVRLGVGDEVAIATFRENEVVCAEPFESIEVELGALWER
ncbi:MAG TPA: Uma2 family endonuclease [Polyangiaceae bacterium]|nr:Uma2 family endonuclease [Polyangiaceae bacterium]